VSRVQTTETLLFRVAERKLGEPYRERGRAKKHIRSDLALYMQAPQASSFAVVLKLGGVKDQLSLGFDLGPLVTDFLDCLEMYNKDDFESLQAHIQDQAYYNNFVGLARELAPDGDRVKTVGLTAVANETERRVALTRPARQPRAKPRMTAPISPPQQKIVVGRLQFANELKEDDNEIRVAADDGTVTAITVPAGMMSDIVRPLWGLVVEAACSPLPRNKLLLEEIAPYVSDDV
jgi:hypothetical protein